MKQWKNFLPIAKELFFIAIFASAACFPFCLRSWCFGKLDDWAFLLLNKLVVCKDCEVVEIDEIFWWGCQLNLCSNLVIWQELVTISISPVPMFRCNDATLVYLSRIRSRWNEVSQVLRLPTCRANIWSHGFVLLGILIIPFECF